MALDQILVADEVPDRVALRHVRAVGHHHHALDAGRRGGELLGDRHEVEIDEEMPVGGVVDDVFELLREQPWIDRVRSEEHTSELQSLMRISYAVFCLKKKKYNHTLLYTQSYLTQFMPESVTIV